MSGSKMKATVLALLAILSGTILDNGCSRPAISTLPFIPPSYYACIEVQPDELLGAYFDGDWGNPEVAAKAYNNLPFIFKNVTVSQWMLTDKENDIFNISTIRCTALLGDAVAKLRIGDVIDIVGMNRGAIADTPEWLLFTECIFLPGGSANLPAPGGPAYVPIY